MNPVNIAVRCLFILLVMMNHHQASASEATESTQCIECHQSEVTNWEASHHNKAMQEATSTAVLGDFSNTRFEDEQSWTRFYKEDERFFIETGKTNETGTSYPVPYVFGIEPLQQVLIDIGEGRYQAYTVAWDSRPKTEGGQRWYNLYQDSHQQNSPFYWKGQFNNWNARCAQCHSTGLQRGYDADKNSYHTTWKEINVSCESCHGDASTHLSLKKTEQIALNSGFVKPLKKKHQWTFESDQNTATMQVDQPAPLNHNQVDDCASCHSRRITLIDGEAHGNFAQHYKPRLAVPDLYHSDGQILDEVYVYGSFAQSKMSSAGVSCSNCHDPHTAKVFTLDNALCSQCHLPTKFDTVSHTLHQPNTQGAKCIDCHMPYTTYMGVDNRRDHAFRVPNPWVAEALKSKDVCLDCHQNKTNQWSQAQLKTRQTEVFGDFSDIGPSLLLLNQNRQEGERHLRALLKDNTQPEMRRAVLANELDLNEQKNIETLFELSNNDSYLIKLGVLRAIESASFPIQLQIGFGLLLDQDKAVRLEAIRILAPAFRRDIPEKAKKPLQDVLYEAINTYQANQDLLYAQLSLADLAYKIGEIEQAKIHYHNAINIQPSFLPTKVNLASIYRESGDYSASKQLLNQVLALEKDHALALFNMGLIYIIEQNINRAVETLAHAVLIEPNNLQFGFTYMLALERQGDITQAIHELNRLKLLTPNDPALTQLEQRLTQ